MPVNNGFITAPVTSPKDIEQALGYSVGGDVGVACSNCRVTGRNADGSFILGTGNINKWAKYKPVKHPSLNRITEAELRNVNYGLAAYEMPEVVSANIYWSAFGTSFVPSPNDWTYTPPTGGITSPYRLTDFTNASQYPSQYSGYNHNAKTFVSGFSDVFISENEIDTAEKWIIPNYILNGYPIGNTSGMEIPINELTIIPGKPITNGEWRFGLALFIQEPASPPKFHSHIVSHETPIKTIADPTTDIRAMWINILGADAIKRQLRRCLSLGQLAIKAIPVILYKSLYVTGDVTNGTYYKFDGGARAFSMPGAPIITINLQKEVVDITIGVKSANIIYMNGSQKNIPITLIPHSEYSSIPSPKRVSATYTSLQYVVYINNPNSIRLENFKIGLGPTYIDNVARISDQDNNVWTSINRTGYYTLQATDNAGSSNIIELLNSLPLNTTIDIGCSVDFTYKGKVYTHRTKCNIRLT